MQSTLIKAMRSLSSWRGEASLFTWLCTICRHEITTTGSGWAATPKDVLALASDFAVPSGLVLSRNVIGRVFDSHENAPHSGRQYLQPTA